MRLALITGGSKGLGAALVQWHLDHGWEVREYSRSGSGSAHIDCDFAQPSSSAATLATTFAELAARPWTELRLINNAGTLEPMGPLEASAADAWTDHLNINVGACVSATGLFLKHFASPTATRMVVNISSGAATTPYHGWSLYCASKAAVEAFTRCVSLEQAQSHAPTTVVAIRPGVIETQMQAAIRSQSAQQFAEVAKFRQLKAAGQLQTPAQAAERVCALLATVLQSGQVYDVRELIPNTA